METLRIALEFLMIIAVFYYKKDSDKMLEENQSILKHIDKIKEKKDVLH